MAPPGPFPCPSAAPAPRTDTDRLRALWREYGQPALIGLGLAAAFLLGFGAYRSYRQNNVVKAAQLLARAGSVEQLQQVVSQYPSTPAAPMAMLTLAARQFDGGQFELAQYTYAQFEQKYAKHPMKSAAELGRAQCLEAMGQMDQAEQAFDAFVAAHPDDYLVPLARLNKARVLAQANKLEEARAAYEDFIAANPESGWLPQAENALDQINRQIRAGPAAVPAPAPAPAVTIPEMSSIPLAPVAADSAAPAPEAPAVTIPETPAPAPAP
ncbi:MAG TPA: tetratricopeptide repeat protein [Kiritimatiellia bacterium]|nr:tetratricopeptide repeat protein [Kiritimatiellia bacterium]